MIWRYTGKVTKPVTLSAKQSSNGPQIPILLLKEGTTETKGRNAKKNNITAAKTIAEVVKTSFGPRGMDKCLLTPLSMLQ